MANRIRQVEAYKRKSPNKKMVRVRTYLQTYDAPRGAVKHVRADILNRLSQTMWLKDKDGHFVGRANAEGRSTARNVSRYGYDATSVLRDSKHYKRIQGRISPYRKRRYF